MCDVNTASIETFPATCDRPAASPRAIAAQQVLPLSKRATGIYRI
jgi:hypothetical protein